MRVYDKYTLKEGSALERRKLLANPRSRIVLKKEANTVRKIKNIGISQMFFNR